MNQTERLDYLIAYLLKEQNEDPPFSIPRRIEDKKRLLRSLMNIRPPVSISQRFLDIQDDYLQQEFACKKITTLEQLKPLSY